MASQIGKSLDEIIVDLLRFREVTLFRQLTEAIAHKTKVEKKNQFEVLMYEVSDDIQNLAQAYGERQALEFCFEALASVKGAGTKAVLDVIFKIYALDMIIRDMGFYLSHGVLNAAAAQSAVAALPLLVKELAKNTLDVIESLNVPTHALYTPIIGDYVKYNEEAHFGEVVNAKL